MSEVNVVVHPLVLLSVIDHYSRMDSPRVAGIILGYGTKEIHVTNSFAVPFEEDEANETWFLDTSFQKSMFDLFKKIHSNERILGWYHTGPNLYKNDSEVTASLLYAVEEPILLIVDVYSEKNEFPIKVFQIKDNNFINLNTCIEAEEAEEVGVEHLIRDIKNSYSEKGKTLKESLIIYEKNLEVIEKYLEDVLSGKIHKNFKILSCLQECLNEIPQMTAGHNDNSMECYLAELTKSIIAINDLEQNRKQSIAQ